MKANTTRWLRANVIAPQLGIDRQAGVIRGMVLAQEGPFKTTGRGEFNAHGIAKVAQLAGLKQGGLKSRFTHPTLSDDGLGKFLGRVRDVRVDKVRVNDRKTIAAARGDLYFDKSAYKTPHGDLANYVMDLAESDKGAISSSLVLQIDEEYRLDTNGNPEADTSGEPLPPLWHPKELHASDIVDTGDAVDDLLSSSLSIDGLPDAIVRRGSEMLDQFFAEAPREVIEARATAWLQRYLDLRFGEQKEKMPIGGIVTAIVDGYVSNVKTATIGLPILKTKLEARRDRLDQMALTLRKIQNYNKPR